MANVGFRKEFFGFKREDVVDYIENLHKKSVKREEGLNSKINELTAKMQDLILDLSNKDMKMSSMEISLSDAQVKNIELSNQKDEIKALREKLVLSEETVNRLAAQIAAYNSSRDEIARLSEGVGKLYLVARTNADAIISEATSNSQIIAEEVNKNIDDIDLTQKQLKQIENNMKETFENFYNNINYLFESLENAKNNINNNMNNIDDKTKEVKSLIGNHQVNQSI